MKKLASFLVRNKKVFAYVLSFVLLIGVSVLLSHQVFAQSEIQVDQPTIGFRIPTFSDILSFAVRGFFIIAGLAALLFLLMGALNWITSGGDKEKTAAAQKQITAAVLGVILVAVVLAIVVTLEQVVFRKSICLGLSCSLTIPSLLKKCGCYENGIYQSCTDPANATFVQNEKDKIEREAIDHKIPACKL